MSGLCKTSKASCYLLVLSVISLGFYVSNALSDDTRAPVASNKTAEMVRLQSGAFDPIGRSASDLLKPATQATNEPVVTLAAGDGLRALTCCAMGGWSDIQNRDTVFTGNVITVDAAALLSELFVELQFSGQVEVTMAVYRQQLGEETEYDLVWGDDVTLTSQSDTEPRFYSSGSISVPLVPLTELGLPIQTKFIIGVGWGNTTGLLYGRGPVTTYPKPYCVGQVEGTWIALGTDPDPLPDPFTRPNFYNGRTVSMNLCFQAPGGACCLPDGSCDDDVTSNGCESTLGGVYQGDYSLCQLSACEPIGACCGVGDGCEDLPLDACTSALGVYKGDGTSCDMTPDPCDPRYGACCYYDGTCTENGNEFDCTADPTRDTPGVWRGYDTECGGIEPCEPMGACCDPEYPDDCVDTIEADCPWCTNIASNGTCIGVVTGLEWRKGWPCSLNACDIGDLGACCVDGECLVTGHVACLNLEGSFTSMGTNGWQACEVFLETNTCPATTTGACCLSDGVCQEDMTQIECENQYGIFQGQGVDCSSFLCSLGACCHEVGGQPACAELFPLECATATTNGVFSGTGSACPADCFPTGACCLPDGSCDVMIDYNCAAAGGTFQGDDVDCEVDTCPPHGACCTPDGCIQEFESVCITIDDAIFQGDDTVCTNGLCPNWGGCCVETTPTSSLCIDSWEFDCNSSGLGVPATFYADASCEGDMYTGCDPGVCCKVDGTCLELTRIECRQIEGALFDDTITSCGLAVCVPRGACCLPNSTCSIMGEADCLAASGDYRGDATMCDGDVCEKYACCQGGGVCADEYSDVCAAGGFITVAGQTCATTDVCDLGACCVNILGQSVCYTEDQWDCGDRPNSAFLGVGVSCAGAQPCVTGTCCEMDGSCFITNSNGCAQVVDAIFTSGSDDCSACAARGACCYDVTPGDHQCDIMNETTCASQLSSKYLGDTVTCAADHCDCYWNYPDVSPNDYDDDGDIDFADFAAFQLCFPGVLAQNDLCLCVFDLDMDGAITLVDFAGFQQALAGPQ